MRRFVQAPETPETPREPERPAVVGAAREERAG